MRVSVVVSTFNRAAGLRQTLDSFRHQTHPDFEVVVVNGPSTDGTADVLAGYADRLKVGRCDKARLCASRNIGLGLSDGDIVAFIDDDAIPEPTWLEHLVAAYADPGVGAAGGIVYDHTGARLQYKYAVCSRAGTVRLDVEPPLDEFAVPKADPFVYMQGTNMSFRRSVLAAVGGFDENILHYYDDVEIALQVIDRGHAVRPLPNAGVHHKYLASHVRTPERITLDPFNLVCDRIYYVLQHGRGTRPTKELFDVVFQSAETAKAQSAHYFSVGKMTAEQRAFHDRRVDEAVEVGLPKGLNSRRASVNVPPARPERFRQHPTVRPEGKRLKLCFLSKEYPPGDFGGVGRYTAELATGFADAGHEVHVVTASPDSSRVDFEQGVWVHRVPAPARWVPDLAATPLTPILALSAADYHEVRRIHDQSPVDLVSAPLWLSEGVTSQLDPRFPTVLTLMTCQKAISAMHPSFRDALVTRQQIALEDESVAGATHVHAISKAILDRAVIDYDADPKKAFVAPLGLVDRRPQFARKRKADGRVRVLFVGRLEVRKGADLLLDAAVKLCRELPQAEFVLAGKDTPHTELGETYRAKFEREYGHDPDLVGRVRFAGMVSEDELFQHYADCDVFCLPSRYESFGLVFVEAMMFGVPVVGCRTGGMVEVIADGEYGHLFAPEDAAGLTDALRKLIADPAHRAALGAAARAAYDRRFAMPVVVANTEAEFRRVIAEHRSTSGTDPLAPPPDGRIADGLAGVIARSTGVPADAARRAADRLLCPISHPVDFFAPLAHIAGLGDADFAFGAFRTILGRDPNAADAAHWAHILHTLGGDRRELARLLIAGWEARHNGVPAELANHLHVVLPPAPVPEIIAAPVAVVAPAARPAGSVRGKLSKLPLAGKAFKYARRVVMLPWNFHKFYSVYGPTAAAHASALSTRVAAVEEAIDARVLPLVRELAAKTDLLREQAAVQNRATLDAHRELRAALDEHVARLAAALGDVAEAVGEDDIGPPVLLPRLSRAAG
jgi:glycogen(starch) synthase